MWKHIWIKKSIELSQFKGTPKSVIDVKTCLSEGEDWKNTLISCTPAARGLAQRGWVWGGTRSIYVSPMMKYILVRKRLKIHIIKHDENSTFWGREHYFPLSPVLLLFVLRAVDVVTNCPDLQRNHMLSFLLLLILLAISITYRPAKWLLPRKKEFLHLLLTVEEVRTVLHCIDKWDRAETVPSPTKTIKIRNCFLLLTSRS